MENNGILKLVYTLFIGVLLVIFVGVGISTFYVAPTAPKYPAELNSYSKEPNDQQLAAQREFDKKNEQYQETMKPYNRNVSILTLLAAVALLGMSIALEKKIKLIADGIMLGGLFSLLYSIGRGFASDNNKYVFLTVTVGLVVTLYLGYHRFVQDHTASAKPQPRKARAR